MDFQQTQTGLLKVLELIKTNPTLQELIKNNPQANNLLNNPNFSKNILNLLNSLKDNSNNISNPTANPNVSANVGSGPGSDDIQQQFKNIIKTALTNPQIQNTINGACDFQKNTEILDIIHLKIKNHIEELLSNTNTNENNINNIVFVIIINLIETPSSKLYETIKGCMNQYPNTKNTIFFHLKQNLPKYIRSVYGVECSQSPIKGETLLNKKINTINNDIKRKTIVNGGDPVSESKVQVQYAEKNLNELISKIETNIGEELAKTVNVMFADETIKESLLKYINGIIKNITDRISGSSLLSGGDFFSVIYFYLMLEKIDESKDKEKIDKINISINKILNSNSNSNVNTNNSIQKSTKGGRRTKRLLRRKKRTQKKRFNNINKSINYGKK